MKQNLLFTIVLLFFSYYSKLDANNPTLKPFNVEGIDHGYNEFIKKDSYGYIWISSIKGVYCFNSSSLDYYSLEYDENVQSNFYEDIEKDIWFTTYTALHKFERTTKKVISIQLKDEKGIILKEGYHIFHIEGNILWLKIGTSIYKYDTRLSKLKYLTSTKGVRFGILKDKEQAVQKIIACPWFNDKGFEIINIDNDKITKEHIWENIVGDKKYIVNSANIWKDSLIYLNTNHGLIRWDHKKPNEKKTLPFPRQNSYKVLNSCFLSEKQLLVPINNHGIWLFDLVSQKYLKEIKLDIYPKRKNPRALHFDGHHLWIAGEDNFRVSYCRISQNCIIEPLKIEKNTPSFISSIVEDWTGNKWCVSKSDGVFVFNNQGKLLTNFVFSKKGVIDNNQIPHIKNLSLDSEGKIWGIGDQKIIYYDLNKKYWQLAAEPFIDRTAFFLLHLTNDKKLISTNKGLIELFFEKSSWHHKNSSALNGSGKNTNIFQLLDGGNGKKYVPCGSNKLKILDQEEKVKELTIKPEAWIYDTYTVQKTGITWFATTKGLAFYDEKKDTFTFKNILSNESLSSIVGGNTEELWLTSSNKLYSFHTQEKKLRVFRPDDGYTDADFYRYASLKASDGKIWLGTNSGLVIFHPDSLFPYSYQPNVDVKKITVNNIPYKPELNPNLQSHIRLAYDENNISLKTEVISYYLPKFNEIFYRIKGHTDNWLKLEKGNLIQLNQLRSGNYIVEIYGENANGLKGEIKRINIRIDLPWWWQWWALLLWFSLFFLSVYIVIKVYIRQKLKKERQIFEKQQALQQERNRIASELHDDLGAGLSIIRVLSERELNNAKLKYKNIFRIFQSSGDLLEKMQDIIWVLNSESDSLKSLIDHLRFYVYDYLDIHQLDCQFDIISEIPIIVVSGEKKRNIIFTVKEILRNTIRHACASKIIMEVCIEDQHLELKIKDDGVGLFIDANKSRGNGLRSIKKRMQDIGGHASFITNQGTQITLNIPLSQTD